MKYSIMYLLLFCIVAVSCNKSSDDNPEANIADGSLTQSPVDLSTVSGLVPLGNLNPPGHTFPTSHMYLYFNTPATPTTLYAPGNLHIFQISRSRTNAGTPSAYEDYKIEMGNQPGTMMFFSHVASLSTALQTAVDGFSGATCQDYSTGGNTFNYCRKSVSIDVAAGDVLGMVNTSPSQFAIDMGALNNGVSICPLAFFNDATRAILEAKLGNYNGTIPRTVAPLCGEYNLNVAETLQGNWYNVANPSSGEDNNIAFVKDNVQPALPRISIGSAVPGLSSDVYTFTPQSSGLVDRPFTSVTNDGQIYCYTPWFLYGVVVPNTSIIVKLEADGTLSFEKRNCDCSCSAPYSFTAAKIVFRKN